MNKLDQSFYSQSEVWHIARELVGKFLFTNISGTPTGGMIVETEAYCGINDRACHANNWKRTRRTRIMYREGGRAYVHLCYGLHYLFNVATNVKGRADAVLIRAIEPVEGIELMMKRRKLKKVLPRLTRGPGSMSKALGINLKHYGTSLLGNKIWIEDRHVLLNGQVMEGPRIGIDYAGEDALKPWRFYLANNIWVSKP